MKGLVALFLVFNAGIGIWRAGVANPYLTLASGFAAGVCLSSLIGIYLIERGRE
jgi:hypothetical protein